MMKLLFYINIGFDTKIVFLNPESHNSMARQKQGLQWRKHTIAIHICTKAISW